jgi:predicted phosphodiesterase
MRVAVISDIHGNDIAFQAVLHDLPSVDQIVCLGDAIQGGPQPHETAQRLRLLNCPVVMGNADAWLLTGVDTSPGESLTQDRIDVREWSLTQLTEEDTAYIKTFQPTITIPMGGDKSLLCFHGSPSSFDDIIYPDTPEDEFCRYLGAHNTSILTGGHTHLQQIRRLHYTFFFNPGSVGFAYNRQLIDGDFRADPWGDYAILSCDNGRTSLEFRRVPFDVDKLIQVFFDSGRPHEQQAVAQYRS